MEIQSPQIIFQVINFSVVLGAVSYLLYKPVLNILNERTKKIQEAQKAAEATLAEKNKLSEVEKDTRKKADKKAAEILTTARENAKKIEQEAAAKAKKKASQELERLKGSWQAEKKQHLADMRKEFSSAVIATAQKVLGEQLTAKKHQRVIDSQLKELINAL